jgi:carnitine O-acetyltransferase
MHRHFNNVLIENILVHFSQFFKVYVYENNGEIISPGKLLGQLKAVVKASQKPTEPVGILTSEHRDTWAEVYSDLVKGVYYGVLW